MSLPPPELVSYLESVPSPHILIDTRYRILAANAAYRRQFGTGPSIIGRTCHEVSHHFERPCDQSGESCPMAMARQSGQRERVLHLHHTSKGEAYVNIELVPLSNAQGEQVFFVEKMEELHGAEGMQSQEGLVGRSPAFRRMLELVSRVGPSKAAVLLVGEELAKRFNNISEDPKIQLGHGVVVTREGVKFNDDGELNFRSFVDGYNAGVAYYFGQAGG